MLIIDRFNQDLENFSLRQLNGFGVDFDPNQQLFIQYLSLCFKYVPSKPRKVFLSSQVRQDLKGLSQCMMLEFQNLIKCAELGGDLNRRCTKLIKKTFKGGGKVSTDGLLADFNIFHFHLGAENNNYFVDRTDELVFAYIDNNNFFILAIKRHSDQDVWIDKDFIEILHRDFPYAIKDFKVDAGMARMASSSSNKTRMASRLKNSNIDIELNDGSVYRSMGFGFDVTGYPEKAKVEEVVAKHVLFRFYKTLNDFLKSKFGEHSSFHVEMISTHNGDNFFRMADYKVSCSGSVFLYRVFNHSGSKSDNNSFIAILGNMNELVYLSI